MNRESTMGWLREAIGFGKIVSTLIGEAANTVLAKVVGAVETEATGDAGDDIWGHAPLLYRPVEPDDDGECEALFYRLGDEKVVFATKDRRFQIEIDEGEVVITTLAADLPSRIHLKTDGTMVLHGEIRVGVEGAVEPLVLGQQLLTILAALTVPTAMGPSGTPLNAADFPNFQSTRHTVDE